MGPALCLDPSCRPEIEARKEAVKETFRASHCLLADGLKSALLVKILSPGCIQCLRKGANGGYLKAKTSI